MLSAFLAALVAAPAPTAPAPAPMIKAQPDTATVNEAVGLLTDQGFEEETMRAAEMTLELMLGTIVEKLRQASAEEIPDDFVKQLRELLHDHQKQALKGNMASIKRQAATIYAKEFSRDELVHLRELSKDPVMVKARERNKVIMPQLMVLGAREMKATESDLEAKIQRLVSEYRAKEAKGADRS